MEARDGEQDDGLVLDLIRAGALSGAYRALARELPDAERGLLKMADRHSLRAATLMEVMIQGRQVEGPADLGL